MNKECAIFNLTTKRNKLFLKLLLFVLFSFTHDVKSSPVSAQEMERNQTQRIQPSDLILGEFFSGDKLPSVLGSQGFVDWVKDRFFTQKRHEEVPESRLLAPDRERIKQVVCEEYCVDEEILHKSKRGTWNEPRNVVIYLFRQLRGEGLDEICGEFGLKRYSSAGSVVGKVKVRLTKEREFRKRVGKDRKSVV